MSNINPFVINDPIHGMINFGINHNNLGQCVKIILDTNYFQRLRRISQLGLTSLVFPGATHSRFSHSIGSAYLAYASLLSILETCNDSTTENEINNNFSNVVISALLHDIGHGPFSHAFEKIGKNFLDSPPSHEDWTCKIITLIKDTIKDNRYNVDFDMVASPFGESKSKYPTYLSSLISSQIDVDRIDYLLRDSHFCGVSIGKIDSDYLIRNLRIIDVESDKCLGISGKGIRSYESFSIARQLMNRSVYYHPKVKVAEEMMIDLMSLVVTNYEYLSDIQYFHNTIPRYFSGFSNNIPKDTFINYKIDEYLMLTEDSIWRLVQSASQYNGYSENHKIIKKLASGILNRETYIYKKIPDNRKYAANKQNEVSGNKDKIICLKSTMYESRDKYPVYVQTGSDGYDDVINKSSILYMMKDREEEDNYILFLDSPDTENICSTDPKPPTVEERKILLDKICGANKKYNALEKTNTSSSNVNTNK